MMRIGIDIRSLQTGHKYRGIGEVTKQVTNRILVQAAKDDHEIIFYEYDDDDPKDLLQLPGNLKYEVIKQGVMPENAEIRSKREKIQHNLDLLYGHPIKGSGKSDVFLQFDYAFGVPKNSRTILVKHDLIPYVFWDKFFESAWVPFKNRAARTTLRTIFANYKYKRILKRSLKDAGLIVSVSESTKNDLKRFFRVSDKKVRVAHLGVDVQPAKTNSTDKTEIMPSKPYLLFIGAGDERRRVDDLVAAYNNLKADGEDIQIVLVGENFKKKEHIPNKRTRDAVLQSSYQKDILTLGYVSDETKQQLFKNSLAFVYPTKYEGFGIPVLESYLLETPVITYKNSSIPEVGGEHALYVKDWYGIVGRVKQLLRESDQERSRRTVAAKKYAEGFTWDKTAKSVYKILVSR